MKKNAYDVFKKWADPDSEFYQHVFTDCSINSMDQKINNAFFESMHECFDDNKKLLKPIKSFLEHMLGLDWDSDHVHYSGSVKRRVTRRLEKFYDLLEHDMPAFVEYLKEKKLGGIALDKLDDKGNFDFMMDRYNAALDLFFPFDEEREQEKWLFAVANRFFRFCFEQESFDYFHSVFKRKAYRPIARLLYSVIWENLSGEGWKFWHAQCLDRLKQDFDAGKEIVYIAGGCDFYRLIEHGIYDITIIDPLLPRTQHTYYIPDWAWFIKGSGKRAGIGDELVFSFDEQKSKTKAQTGKKKAQKTIVLKRARFEQFEDFKAKLSSKSTVTIPKSVTVWDVHEVSSGRKKKLGSITIDRRFATQDDFKRSPKKSFLMSFNELYFIATPASLGGWGINPARFDKDFSLSIKQLAQPVTRQMIKHMREIEKADIDFIALGSCVT